jgi:hypothetical protein
MLTADGRSTVEAEIEQMQFTGLDRRKPVLGLDYADMPAEHEDEPLLPAPSFLIRWIERLFKVARPSAQ